MPTSPRALATFAVAATFAIASPSWAADTPAKLDGTTVVSADQVKQLQAKGTPVIDTRVAAEFAESHIPGAISVPYKEKSAKAVDFDAAVDSFDLSKLPANKGAAVVFYCGGTSCWKSYKASILASKAGYKNIQWFRGGMPEWTSKGLPTE